MYIIKEVDICKLLLFRRQMNDKDTITKNNDFLFKTYRKRFIDFIIRRRVRIRFMNETFLYTFIKGGLYLL